MQNMMCVHLLQMDIYFSKVYEDNEIYMHSETMKL